MFCINTDGLPTIRSYEEAQKKYEKVTPIQRRETDTRPLGLRRKTWMRIAKNGDNYEAILYRTALLTYKPDDTIEVNFGQWVSTSSLKFISALLGQHRVSCGTVANKPVMYAIGGKSYRMFDGMQLRWDTQTNSPVVLNPKETCVHVVKRKALNEKRKTIKEFWEYTKNMCAISPTATLGGDDIGGLRKYDTDTMCQRLVGLIHDATVPEPDYEKMLRVWKQVAYMSCPCKTEFDRETSSYKKVLAFVDEAKMLKYISDGLKYHYRDEVFEEVAIPVGEVKTDHNLKFFY